MTAGEYYYADPTGNITILAPHPANRAALKPKAAKLMALEPSAEQVGFLSAGDSDCDISLQMAGGEFCGNAAMSAAAVFAEENRLKDAIIRVRVSGTPNPVPVRIRTLSSSFFSGTVSMPQPLSMEETVISCGNAFLPVTAVRLPGITHLVCEHPVDRLSAEASIASWCEQFQADAVGLILLDAEKDTLTPLVFVRGSGTLFWESSCASGTAAAGAVLCRKNGPVSRSFTEPAGSLRIDVPGDGSLYLTGCVTIEKRRMK